LQKSICEAKKHNQTLLLKTNFLIIGFLILNNVLAQNQQKYPELINEAWNLYENKMFLQAGQKYSEAFSSLGNRGYNNHR